MFYIFNKNNQCICKCNYLPNEDDLTLRDESFIQSDKNYNIKYIELIDNKISIKSISFDDRLNESKQNIISKINQYLYSTQQEAILHLEGIISDEEYSSIREKRNRLYLILKEIKASDSITLEELDSFIKKINT